jgi:hypothetical protein
MRGVSLQRLRLLVFSEAAAHGRPLSVLLLHLCLAVNSLSSAVASSSARALIPRTSKS